MKQNLKKISLLLAFLLIAAQIMTLGVFAEDEELSSWDAYTKTSIVWFWIIVILFGFVAPIALLVIGILFARSESKGYPKYWYILSWIAAAWIFFAALLLVLLFT